MLLQRAKGYSHVIGDALERFLARTYRGKNVAFAWGKAVLFRECRKVLVRSAFIGGSFGFRFFLGLGGLHLRGSELRQLYGFDLGLMPRGATHVFERVGNKEGDHG